jgi:ABC-2 type transport system ATP-binding protein
MNALEILALEKVYTVGFWRKQPRRALHPLTLSVREGEVFGFLGPNGAGKTTTLKMLMGLMYPTGGSAKIFGMDISDLRVKAQIGFLPEQPYFYDYLTANELLDYYSRLSGFPGVNVSGRERKARIASMLSRVGLTGSGDVQLRKFSKGMLQRVGIAQAILHEPKFVFLDEPMSGLDPIGRREVRDLIEQLKREGKTVFFSTHILSDAETLCDRVAVIHQGELRGVGSVAELTRNVQGKIEVAWHGTSVPSALQALTAEYSCAGDMGRAVVTEPQLDAALDGLRREKLRLISVTPVRSTLEEYFVQQTNSQTASQTNCQKGASA